MKRDFSNLQRENAANNSDARLRRRLQLLKDAELHAGRQEQAKKVEIGRLEDNIKKWNEENVRSVTNFKIVEPELIPSGTQL